MADQVTQIKKVFLTGCAFVEFYMPPFVDEGLRSKGRGQRLPRDDVVTASSIASIERGRKRADHTNFNRRLTLPSPHVKLAAS
jgi:hypothetical protein